MNMLSKTPYYVKTVRHLKPSQIAFRIWRRMGRKTPLRRGYVPQPNAANANIGNVAVLPELDFDQTFLGRFNVDAIVDDRVSLLHHEEAIDWDTSWRIETVSPLWRFNLHYFEYLIPLAKAFLETGDTRFLEKGKEAVCSWIRTCPESRGGSAWDPYTVSMRVVNWLAFYGELIETIDSDPFFVELFNESLLEQYRYLAQHLERDLLANHYLENLKALVILACYFDDGATLLIALPMLKNQVDEQILSDGMHFELSPMYHKVVLEDLLRVAATLAKDGEKSTVAASFRLQEMVDCLYSMEVGTDRTPLFNDSGDNVAKSCSALLECAEKRFDIRPRQRDALPQAGYAFLERDTCAGHVKLVFDVGRLGPEEALGHAHCDALSFEVFMDGEPWIVNLGTYAYQDESRLTRKATHSHNAPMLNDVEQAECWAPFRIGAHGRAYLDALETYCATAHFEYQSGRVVKRTITVLEHCIRIEDFAPGGGAVESTVHFTDAFAPPAESEQESSYSPEFGLELNGYKKTYRGAGVLAFELAYPAERIEGK